jgi:cellulose synthase/poly-beta-1,6-N-acetylglucosamine synthase-like glycosyltransferase
MAAEPDIMRLCSFGLQPRGRSRPRPDKPAFLRDGKRLKVLLIIYAAAGAFLWLSAFGYLIALRTIASRRRPPEPRAGRDGPKVAIVVPALNEERFIADKIKDLSAGDYPQERVSIIVVDGGSVDATLPLAEKEAERDGSIRIIRLARVSSKLDQIRQGLEAVNEDIVIFTDVDSRLAPSCVRELVLDLLRNPETALLGASVEPATDLIEERIHWTFLNYLWWLEGEALGAGMFSAVCYAVRRQALLPLIGEFAQEKADDVHLAHLLAGEGLRVRLSRRALATEVRVPRTPKELLEFRRRRGTKYIRALLAVHPGPNASAGVRLARFMRLWHFQGSPVLAAVLAVASAGLLIAGNWITPALFAAAFVLPPLFVILTSASIGVRGWTRLVWAGAGVRVALWTWLSLLRIDRRVIFRAAPKVIR